jgi:copper chaperone CopZ
MNALFSGAVTLFRTTPQPSSLVHHPFKKEQLLSKNTRKLVLALAFLFSLSVNAQVKKVSLQASGLTCSMCSNAIFKSLKSIDFVEKVDANIKNSSFELSFKPGATVDFDRLRKKVEDAGFFVAAFTATINFEHIKVARDTHILVDGNYYHFLNDKEQLLDGEKRVQLLDKGFVPAKEYKKNARLTAMECYKTGVMAPCCSKEGAAAPGRIFHVII